MNTSKNEMRDFFFKASKAQFNRCLAPGMQCQAKAIRAHSVQNSKVLDLLCRNDHVKAIAKRIDKGKGPIIYFDDVSRNQATTFTGLCSKHDTEIFRPVETQPIDPTNQQHLFLIAYRAAIRELHAVMDGARKIQLGYLKRVEVGWDSGDEPSPAGMFAVHHMMKAYLSYLFKQQLDAALAAGHYEQLVHRVFYIAHPQPTIAVSSVFSIDGAVRDDDWVRVALNILPVSPKETVVVFSYLLADQGLVVNALAKILTSNGHYQKYQLSKLILNNCENFVLAPSYYDTWSAEKTNAVTQYFVQTLFTGNLDEENDQLYLF
jgi:hypothetical protein